MFGRQDKGSHIEGKAEHFQRRLPSNKKVLKPNMKDVEKKLKEKRTSATGPSCVGGNVPTAADIEARRKAQEEAEKKKRREEFADQRAAMLNQQNAASFSRKNNNLTGHPGGAKR